MTFNPKTQPRRPNPQSPRPFALLLWVGSGRDRCAWSDRGEKLRARSRLHAVITMRAVEMKEGCVAGAGEAGGGQVCRRRMLGVGCIMNEMKAE
jgi:hypothetical protein